MQHPIPPAPTVNPPDQPTAILSANVLDEGADAEEAGILRRSKRLASMVESYLETALFATTDGETGEPFDALYTTDDFSSDALQEAIADCAAFLADNREDIGDEVSRAGHDFWLTRNHHGAGFWDEDWPQPAARRLTQDSHAYGSVDCYIGDDGRIYFA